MSLFETLEFAPSYPHLDWNDKFAQIFFENGYGVSVITGDHSYTNKARPFEVAILKGNKDHNNLCYDTDLTSDVIGYNTQDMVEELLLKVKSL